MVAPRVGAGSAAAVPKERLRKLENGEIETLNLAEVSAIDFARLLAATVPAVSAAKRKQVDPKVGITRRMQIVGQILLEHGGADCFNNLKSHPSDTVRGWSAYVLAATPGLTLKRRLASARVLADDPHFGVREWAWLALRPAVASDPDQAIAMLTPWVRHKSPRVRRFAVEITRPRGVWCSHLAALKADPAPGLGLLEPLRADPARYVQDSVANWLNDAGKSNPDWVSDVCRRWSKHGDSPHTAYICRRATRSLTSKGRPKK